MIVPLAPSFTPRLRSVMLGLMSRAKVVFRPLGSSPGDRRNGLKTGLSPGSSRVARYMGVGLMYITVTTSASHFPSAGMLFLLSITIT